MWKAEKANFSPMTNVKWYRPCHNCNLDQLYHSTWSWYDSWMKASSQSLYVENFSFGKTVQLVLVSSSWRMVLFKVMAKVFLNVSCDCWLPSISSPLSSKSVEISGRDEFRLLSFRRIFTLYLVKSFNSMAIDWKCWSHNCICQCVSLICRTLLIYSFLYYNLSRFIFRNF